MPLIVQKYGGSSVADAGKILSVARRIGAVRQAGTDVVAVVSAMGDTTDELIELAHSVSREPHARELDLLLSTGELVSCTLLTMALRELGHEAISLSGPQAGIHTDTSFGRARISRIEAGRVRRELAAGRIVVVAGFQGITAEDDVTTLGRGGSDTTAVAIAAALEADRCEIYTDVEGIYTADPRIAPDARTRMTAVIPGYPEQPDDGWDPKAPGNVSPLVVWLGSADCDVSGRVFECTGGQLNMCDGWQHGPVMSVGDRAMTVAEAAELARLSVEAEEPPAPVYGTR